MSNISVQAGSARLKIVLLLLIIQSGLQSIADTTNETEAKQPGLVVSAGWIRLMPPVSRNTAAYFTLYNQSDETIILQNVSTAIAEKTTLHDVKISQGMTSMVPLNQLMIAAGEKVVFAPGGKHLMLVNLTEKLQLNKDVTIKFTLKNGEVIIAIMQSYRQAPLSSETEEEGKATKGSSHHQH